MDWIRARLLQNGILVMVATAASAFAQDVPVPTLKTGTSLVAVSAVVRDHTGNAIVGLTRDDFILKQEGKLQEIRFFSQGSDLPLTLALLVDTSFSQVSLMAEQMAAGRVFFPAVITQPQDRGVLVQFDCTVQQLAKMTASVPTLVQALDRVTPMTGNFTCERPRRRHAALRCRGRRRAHGTKRCERTRAMVILSDGDDHGSRANSEMSMRRRSVPIPPSTRCIAAAWAAEKTGSKSSPKATGGRVFTVSKTMTLQRIFAEISDDLRLQYQIGYRAPDPRPNRYHRIDVKAKDNKLLVQARNAYFTPK